MPRKQKQEVEEVQQQEIEQDQETEQTDIDSGEDSDETLNEEDVQAVTETVEEQTPTSPVKKKRGRPAGSKNGPVNVQIVKVVKVPKERVRKPKIVYCVEEGDGQLIEVDKSTLKPAQIKPTKKELKLLENEKLVEQVEQEIGKRIKTTAKGKPDKRSTTRTDAQIEATRKLVESNKQRRLDRLNNEKKDSAEIVKTSVKEVLKEALEDKKPVPKAKPRVKDYSSEFC
jgi:mono/diheme cytochrome c family protein